MKQLTFLLLTAASTASAKIVESYEGGPNFNIDYDLKEQVLKIDMYRVNR